jgi:hypothetical protein
MLAIALTSNDPCGTLPVSDGSRQNLHAFFTSSSSLDADMRAHSDVELQDSTIQVELATDTTACASLVTFIETHLAATVGDTAFWQDRGWDYRVLHAGSYDVVMMLPRAQADVEESRPALAIVLRDDEVVTVLIV